MILKKEKKAMKFNVLEIAKHHRKYCVGEDCVVSLNLLRKMAEDLEIKFTEEELKEFL